MSLLAPLGFLGLLGLGILILIYLLKPNYQQKLVSSTFVWKLSLKYRRKKIPINKIRNILILICQILIIILCAFIMTGPVQQHEVDVANEKVIIIDASASMLAQSNNTTRYKRAVDRAREMVDTVLSDKDGVVSIVLAGAENEVLVHRATSDMSVEINAVFEELLATDKDGIFESCTFGTGDVNGAVSTAEEIVLDNDGAEIVLFTGTKYIEKGGITIVDVSAVGEWNAAILDCKATLEDGYYVFELEVASYGADRELAVEGVVHGANRQKEGDDYITFDVPLTSQRTTFISDEVSIITFRTADEITPIYTYDDAYFTVSGAGGSGSSVDSFAYDNYFYLFNGNADARTIRVEYYSSRPNSFVPMALSAVRSVYQNKFDISVTHVRDGAPILEGFDLYIFEHTMPSDMPTDGVVLLFDPNAIPRGLNGVFLDTGNVTSGDFMLAPGYSNPLTTYLDWASIYVSEYTPMRFDADSGFVSALYCGGDPALAVKNTPDSKVVIMPFSLNMSSFPGIVHLPTLFRNILNYYFPLVATEDTEDMRTILSSNNVFSVNENIRLRSRGLELGLTGGGLDESYIIPVGEYEKTKISRSGTYTLTQEVISGKIISNSFFVQIPNNESYINKEADILITRIEKKARDVFNKDLIIYFAATMLLLLVAEWWLHSRELRV